MNRITRTLLFSLSAALLLAGGAAPASAQQSPAAAAEQTVTLTAADRARYVGAYELETPDGMMVIRIFEQGEALMGQPEHEDEPSVLTPLGDPRFRPVLMSEAVLRFTVENDRATAFAIDFPDERGTVMAFRRP